MGHLKVDQTYNSLPMHFFIRRPHLTSNQLRISTMVLKIKPSIKNITHHISINNPKIIPIYLYKYFIMLVQLMVLFQG